MMSVTRLLLLFSLMRKDQILGLLSSSGPSNISSITRKFGSHLLRFTEGRQVSLTGQREFTTSQTGMTDTSASSTISAAEHVSALQFDNRNLRELPVDKETRTFPRQVLNAVSSRCKPTPVNSPAFIACSVDALKLIGLTIASSQEATYPSSLNKEALKMLETYFSGNELLPGSETSAHCYCGHQFGNFAGQLGDGAAISLGEIMNDGHRWELQLKGSGLTPFSRTADGRKVLRSSIREFLCSEAMHYLNIPTTRAATLVTSASTVQRDPFYDGGVLAEKCTIVSRIAPNFFRFGSFEIFKSDGSRKGPSAGNAALKKQLLDHVLTYYPTISKSDLDQSERYEAFFTEIVRRTANLAARWQAVGFVHGVLNTDNMSIMGLTIDYGPFAFEEHFDPDFTPNGSDGGGRYTYAFQPSMCKWNLNKLAEQLSPLIPLAHSIEILNREWDDAYEGTYSTLMHQKLGLLKTLDGDKELIEDYFTVMSATRTDFTDSFQALTDYSAGKSDAAKLLDNLVSRGATPVEKIAMMRRKMKIHRLGMQPSQIQALWDMIINKPNEVTEMFGGAPIEAIKSEIEGEMRNLERQSKAVQEIKRLETNVSAAQKADEDRVLWAKWLEKYHTRLSLDGTDFVQNEVRVKVMKEINPTFVLRNWIAQDAIAAAEKGNYEEVNTVMSMLRTPYAEEFSTFNSKSSNDTNTITSRYTQTAPPGADGLICTCSS